MVMNFALSRVVFHYPLGEHAASRHPSRGGGAILLALFHPDYTVGSGISPDLLTLP
jgi:hypothetical protein